MCTASTALPARKATFVLQKATFFCLPQQHFTLQKNQISTHLNCFSQSFNVRSFMILHFSLTEMQQHILLVDKVDNIGVTFQVPGSFWSGLSGVDRKKKKGSRDCFLGPKLPMA
jgi:hypothetical protein